MPRSRSSVEKVTESPHAGLRGCAHPDCAAEGSFRAPRSRHELDQHIWLCLDHIREYNRTWDYFAGMSQAEIEAHVERDIIGWRPTGPLGRLGANQPERTKESETGNRRRRSTGPRWSGAKPAGDPFAHVRDDFGLFGEASQRARRDRAEAGAGFQRRYRARDEETQALDTLGLSQPLSLATLKARYKELVKRFHPDANGGDKAAEERLKLVNQAYATLKNSVSLP
jgi:hypothetical protein